MIDLELINNFDVSDTSKRNYISSARVLNTFIKDTKLTSFKKIEDLINKHIKKHNKQISTSLTFYKILSKLTKDKKTTNKKYRDKIMEINELINKEKPKKLEEVKNKFKDIDYIKIKNDFIKKIKENYYKTNEREFILCLYLLQPPRRLEYSNMVFVEHTEDIDDITNYLLSIDRAYFFKFQDHKNKNKVGTQNIKIDDYDLFKIILNKNFKHNQKIYSKSKKTYQRDIKKITKEVFGIEMSVNDIRKIHSSTLFSETKKQMEIMSIDAEKMGHSNSVKLNNYIY